MSDGTASPDEHRDDQICRLTARVKKLEKKSHPPRHIPDERLVLEWVSRDRLDKRRKRREGAIMVAIILLVGGFTLFGILCTIGQVVAALS